MTALHMRMVRDFRWTFPFRTRVDISHEGGCPCGLFRNKDLGTKDGMHVVIAVETFSPSSS